MKQRTNAFYIGFTILIFISASLAVLLLEDTSPPSIESEPGAYIEPGLVNARVEIISVIATAEDSFSAAAAIESVGGQVSSNLWLIDAAAATIPTTALPQLAHIPGVQSIVANKTLTASHEPPEDPPPSETYYNWTGYFGEGFAANCLNETSTSGFDTTAKTQCTSVGLTTNESWPVSVDVGADRLHEIGITGEGVTIAMVDSGVQYDNLLFFGDQEFVLQLKGQADFVGNGMCSGTDWYRELQYPTHCFEMYSRTYDANGHGTHLAGTMIGQYQDVETGIHLGIAPKSQILSVRVLGEDGSGTYEDVIEGIQYVVETKDNFDTKILNLSLSATPTTPYFVDPLNRAVEEAWAAGIVVVAAAGNTGPGAQSITVPGNNPYIITVGSIDTRKTAGDWSDDVLPTWSSTGPTLEGFLKPDILAPGGSVISYMYNDPDNAEETAKIALQHPDYSETTSWFRLNGTSVSSAVASGVAALMLQENPGLTPDEVKFRLMYSAQQFASDDSGMGYNFLQQGAGRIWAPDAVNGTFPDGAKANVGMDIRQDLDHSWGYYDDRGNPIMDETELNHHYLGAVRTLTSENGLFALYYVDNGDASSVAIGVVERETQAWLLADQVPEPTTWSVGQMIWSGGTMVWSGGGFDWSTGPLFDNTGIMVWSGGVLSWNNQGLFDNNGRLIWNGGELFDASGMMVWSGGEMYWPGGAMKWADERVIWNTDALFDASGMMVWSGGNMFWAGSHLFDLNGNLIWENGPLFDTSGQTIWSGGQMVWSGGMMVWSGGNMVWSGANMVWSGGNMIWSGGQMLWSGGNMVWSGGQMLWSGANMVWSGGQMLWSGANMVWSGGNMVWSGGQMLWSGSATPATSASASRWVDDLVWEGLVLFDPPNPPDPPDPPNPPDPPDLATHFFVTDLDAYSYESYYSTWKADITVTVLDNNGDPAANMKVKATTTNPRTLPSTISCVTDELGQCTMTSKRYRNYHAEIIFTVDELIDLDGTLIYDPACNFDPDGDSDGTIMVIAKP